ncbi:trimethylamine methyltransferase family protein [Lutimaribacter marinistellae]|uniref:Methyltransferase n=1 Tax=Lutimaribacter marinistellae TaxID=1820329 RepID=A0ABV7TI47_9RHOB
MTEQRRGRRGRVAASAPQRQVDYRNLRSPFPTMNAISEDRVEALHEAALTILEETGIKVLHDEARTFYEKGGARVSDDMVFIGRDMIEAALATAPRSITVKGGAPHRDITLELGRIVFQPGAGCPHATDLDRGRRPGTLRDFRELVQLTQSFDVLHMVPPLVEAQDVAMNLRHLAMTEIQLTQSDKVPFLYSRGTPQVMDGFEMIRDFRGLTDAEFRAQPWCYTIINTNSPRTIDLPMAQGLIDFARNGQPSIVTPFTLMGAMAPVTVAGAITLSHAEALAAITLTQLVNPGAPVCYGTFTSNVDMKSGAPAFGTPEHFSASLVAGQLARKIGLPWRCAGGSAANIADAQAANESQFALWGCLLAGATITIHSAGWIEGGLSISYEKMITDLEVLQMVAELCAGTPATEGDIALDAIRDVAPMGHFFGAQHTMDRYQTQFYEPLVGDWSNFGTWTERGGIDASTRATGIWKRKLAEFQPPATDSDRLSALEQFVARRTAEGGANPES